MATTTTADSPAKAEPTKGLIGHLTLSFPMISPTDGEAFREELKAVIPEMHRAADAMETIHYSRFFELSVKRFYFLAVYDGELEAFLADFASHFGSSFDKIFSRVSEAPPTPVAENVNAFVGWAKEHCIKPFLTYEACPGVSVKKIKALAANAGITLDENPGSQLPLMPIMPVKSGLAAAALKLTLGALSGLLTKGADGVGTVHFVHLADFSDSEVGFFTSYDGLWDKYLYDFATQMGPAFDFIFKFIENPAPTPTAKHPNEFSKWVFEHEWVPIGFYNAYPGLTVQDIKAMVADASA